MEAGACRGRWGWNAGAAEKIYWLAARVGLSFAFNVRTGSLLPAKTSNPVKKSLSPGLASVKQGKRILQKY